MSQSLVECISCQGHVGLSQGAYLGPPRAGDLLQGLGDSFVLSMGLINRNSNSFDFFEEPPAVLVSPIVSMELYNSGPAF